MNVGVFPELAVVRTRLSQRQAGLVLGRSCNADSLGAPMAERATASAGVQYLWHGALGANGAGSHPELFPHILSTARPIMEKLSLL